MVDPHWKPHTSWHASGQYHNKSSGMKLGAVQHRQKPDAQFHGTQICVATSITLQEVRTVNVPCNPQDFADVFEIPHTDLLPGIGRMQLSIDLTEPAALPLIPHSICPGFKIVAQKAFQDVRPWIVVTLFDTCATLQPHDPSLCT